MKKLIEVSGRVVSLEYYMKPIKVSGKIQWIDEEAGIAKCRANVQDVTIYTSPIQQPFNGVFSGCAIKIIAKEIEEIEVACCE